MIAKQKTVIKRNWGKSIKGEPRTYYKLWVTLNNTNRDVLRMVQLQFGGSIHADTRDDIRHRHIVYKLVLITRQAYTFLKTIQPYCIVKKQHIKNAIGFYEYQSLGRHSIRNRLTPEDLAIYEQRFKVAQAYNKRLL